MEEDTRKKILLAAGETFAEMGLESSTVRRISERAGVNLASINYHFHSKEQLYIESIKYVHQFRQEQFPLPNWPLGTSPEIRLRDFIHTMITRMLVAKELPWQARLMMREMLQPTGACRELAQDLFRPHFLILLEILGEMTPPGWPLHQLQQLAFSVVGQCLFYKFNKEVIQLLVHEDDLQKHYQPEKIGEHIISMTLAALGRVPLFAQSPTCQTIDCRVETEIPTTKS